MATDLSSNLKLKDIGLVLRDRINAHFQARGVEATLAYLDPSYHHPQRPRVPVGQRVLLEHGPERGPRGHGGQHRDADRPVARPLRARADAPGRPHAQAGGPDGRPVDGRRGGHGAAASRSTSSTRSARIRREISTQSRKGARSQKERVGSAIVPRASGSLRAIMAGMKISLPSRSLVLAGLACLAGCTKEPAPLARRGSRPRPRRRPRRRAETSPAAAPAGGAARRRPGNRAAPTEARCEADADCVVSCARAGQCCDQLCPPCSQAFHRDALAELQKWRAASCAAASCPVAKCMAPKEDSVARCKAGACVVERVPHVDR